jgi:phosphoribosylaminoimidazolecarboxamide formyltransferase / IMP cyclohydrolase
MPEDGALGSMYAVLSVWDKTGILELGAGLRDLGASILSTRGTAELLRRAGVDATVIGDVSGVPELMGGRVRAFHHSIFGGLLYRRGNPSDEEEARRHGIPRIDVLACNFRDPEPDGMTGAALDAIDIGGPAMVRAAAKNFRDVLPIVDPADYPEVLSALGSAHGAVADIEPALRRALARKAFGRTAAYDLAIQRLLDN